VPSVNTAVARLAADEFAAFARLRDGTDLRAWGESLLVALSERCWSRRSPSTSAPPLTCPVVGRASAPTIYCAAQIWRSSRHAAKSAPWRSTTTPAKSPRATNCRCSANCGAPSNRTNCGSSTAQDRIGDRPGGGRGSALAMATSDPGLLSPARSSRLPSKPIHTANHPLDPGSGHGPGAAWHRSGSPLQLAVNISADDLADTQLARRVAGLLTRHQLPPSLLTLEVTESGFIEDPVSALAMLDALAQLRVLISIDDFGTGYSSLSHLARMPATR